MRRLFVLAVLCALFAASVSRVAAALPSLAAALQSAAALIDVQVRAIPVPAVTTADKAALKAWTAAGRSVDQAIADPRPSRVAGLVGKMDKSLVKALGSSPAVNEVLDALTDGLLAGTAQLLADTRAAVMDLPPGAGTDALLAKLDTADSLLNDAQGQATRAGARALAGRALRIAAAVERLRKRQLDQLVAVDGLSASADGVRVRIRNLFTGIVTKDGTTGEPLAITMEWRRTEKEGSPAEVSRSLWFRIDPTHLPGDPPEGVPTRTLELDRPYPASFSVAAAYTSRRGNEGTMQIDSVTGWVTLHSLDTRDAKAFAPGFGRASVSGVFTFSGFDAGGTGSPPTVSGSFNVHKYDAKGRPVGPLVAPPPGPIHLKTR